MSGHGIARTLLFAALALFALADWAAAEAGVSDCRCRYFGEYFKQGATVCMATPDGPKLARCTMTLNNSSWKITDQTCPVSRLWPLERNTLLACAKTPAAAS